MTNQDRSLFAFRQLSADLKKKYLDQARKINERIINDIVIELIAANLWAQDMRRKNGR